jgi:hypothetical protein
MERLKGEAKACGVPVLRMQGTIADYSGRKTRGDP